MTVTKYQYNKLKAKIVERNCTFQECAKVVGCTNNTFGNKMQGLSAWNLDEVYNLCCFLMIPACDIHIYFPNRKLNKSGMKMP